MEKNTIYLCCNVSKTDPKKTYMSLGVDLGYAVRYIMFGTAQIAEVLNLSCAQLYELCPKVGARVEVGSLVAPIE